MYAIERVRASQGDARKIPLGINLTVVEAGELFLSCLADVSDPEKKRKIKVIDLFEKEAIRVGRMKQKILPTPERWNGLFARDTVP